MSSTNLSLQQTVKRLQENGSIKSLRQADLQSAQSPTAGESKVSLFLTKEERKHALQLQKTIVSLQDAQDCETVIHIMKKGTRSLEEARFLQRAVFSIEIMRETQEVFARCDPYVLSKSFRLKSFAKYQTIFEYGDVGNTFYVVLDGRVACLTPDAEKIARDEDARRQHTNQQSTSFDLLQDRRRRLSRVQDTNFALRGPTSHQGASSEGTGNKVQSEAVMLQSIYPRMAVAKFFERGESFGEIALITHQRRTASMVCTAPTQCLVVLKSAFESIVGTHQRQREMQKIQFFRRYAFLQEIPTAILLSLLRQVAQRVCQEGETLFSEGDTTNAVYFVFRGTVSLSKIHALPIRNARRLGSDEICSTPLAAASRNERVTLALLSTGSFVGEEEVLLRQPLRLSRAEVCQEDTELFVVPKELLLSNLRMFKGMEVFAAETARKSALHILALQRKEQVQAAQSVYHLQLSDRQERQRSIPFLKQQQQSPSRTAVPQSLRKSMLMRKRRELRGCRKFPIVKVLEIPRRFRTDNNFTTISKEFLDPDSKRNSNKNEGDQQHSQQQQEQEERHYLRPTRKQQLQMHIRTEQDQDASCESVTVFDVTRAPATTDDPRSSSKRRTSLHQLSTTLGSEHPQQEFQTPLKNSRASLPLLFQKQRNNIKTLGNTTRTNHLSNTDKTNNQLVKILDQLSPSPVNVSQTTTVDNSKKNILRLISSPAICDQLHIKRLQQEQIRRKQKKFQMSSLKSHLINSSYFASKETHLQQNQQQQQQYI